MIKRVDLVDTEIGKNLKRIRKRMGFSQKDIGKMTGISSQQIQKYESGENRLSAGRLFTIANKLQIPADWFFDGLETRQTIVQVDIDKFDDETQDIIRLLHSIPNKGLKRQIKQIINVMSA